MSTLTLPLGGFTSSMGVLHVPLLCEPRQVTAGSESLFQVNPFFGVLRQDLPKQPGWPGTQSPSAPASAVLGSLCAVAVASFALALMDSDQQSSRSQTGGRQQRNNPFGLSHRDLGAVTVTAFIVKDTSAWPPHLHL